jgi:rfaE bifunctional protein kinase chain/domain/rfaE bifunctional protein nucleotidyltransferase chain/domain
MADGPRHQRKILELDSLLNLLHDRSADGATVVQCHGCFDIVHPGHIRYLEFASRQGDILVVTLTGDSEISKATQSPYIPQELRAESLAALEFVDYVYIDPSPTAESVLEAIRPDVYVKGREYEVSRDPRFLREKEVVESYGGRVIFSSGDVIFSSTALVATLPRAQQIEQERLKLVCRRHGVSHPTLRDAIGRFNGLRVGVIGDVILDRYVFCDAHDVASESPMLSLAEIERREYVGGAAIVARHVAALGAQSCLITNLADDDASARARAVLADEGVELHALATRPRLVEKTRYLVEENKLFKVETGDNTPLDSQAERDAAILIEQQARHLDAVVFCDFGYGVVTAGLLERVLPCLRANTAVMSADVSGSRGSLRNFRNVDLLCPTERELRETLHDYEEGLSSVAYRLLAETQARHLLCTLGKDGLVAFRRPGQQPGTRAWVERLQSEHFKSFADRSIDRLGCGDALLAAATLTLAAGGSLMSAAYLGNAASAIEIGILGNQPVTATMLCDWLSRRPEVPHPSAAAHA